MAEKATIVGVAVYPADDDWGTLTFLFADDDEAEQFARKATDMLGLGAIASVFAGQVSTPDEALAMLEATINGGTVEQTESEVSA